MRRFGWQVALGLLLVAVSAATYTAQIVVFGRPRDTLFYIFQDLAFVPVQVLLVTLVVNEVLKLRERSLLRHKMNMVIGAFFVEVGYDLLERLPTFSGGIEQMRQRVIVTADWSDTDFVSARRLARDADYALDIRKGELAGLKSFLMGKKDFILGLLGNANLLEHESFTDLLWALSHLTEELAHRSSLESLPATDYEHLTTDLHRACGALIYEWLGYIRHLKGQYPYMFSLVVRTNPFDPDASAVVQ